MPPDGWAADTGPDRGRHHRHREPPVAHVDRGGQLHGAEVPRAGGQRDRADRRQLEPHRRARHRHQLHRQVHRRRERRHPHHRAGGDQRRDRHQPRLHPRDAGDLSRGRLRPADRAANHALQHQHRRQPDGHRLQQLRRQDARRRPPPRTPARPNINPTPSVSNVKYQTYGTRAAPPSPPTPRGSRPRTSPSRTTSSSRPWARPRFRRSR